MATLELTSLGLSNTDKDRGSSDDLLHARHARQQAMPAYHEDSGEYVSASNESIIDERTGLMPSEGRIVLGPVGEDEEEDLYATESIPGSQEAHDLELDSQAAPSQVVLENATKKDIKAYLSANTFECASEHDAEKLSEFAYAPTDKGTILSVEKPFGNANFKRMKALLSRRVKPSRFVHSVMVAKTAEKMALAYGVDPRVARTAGLLHDWDKALSPKRLRDRVACYQLDIDGPTQINMPQLLHGPTAAAVLADEFPEFGEEVFQAIERHTVGGLRMTPLDMIVFCADKIEPGNDVQVYRDLHDQIGKIDLKDLFLAVQREGFIYLLHSTRPLNVDAVEVWNFYCAEKQRDSE